MKNIVKMIDEGKYSDAKKVVFKQMDEMKDELLNSAKEMFDPSEIPGDYDLKEAYKRVIKGGEVIKKKVKPKSKKKGYKVSSGKIKKMGALEILHRKKSAKKTAKKLKAKKLSIARTRKKSMRKRKQIIGK